MELIAYFKYLFTYWLWLLIGLIIGGVVAAFVATSAADAYSATVSIYVQRAPDPTNENYFTYEGYYAQQTAAAYAETALNLLSNDEIIKRAATSAGLPTDVGSLSAIKGQIVSTQEAPQLIKITVNQPTREQAAGLAEGLAQAVKLRTTEINQAGGDDKLTIEQIDLEPFVILVRPLLWLYMAVGLLLGLVTSMVITAFWVYARHQVKSKS